MFGERQQPGECFNFSWSRSSDTRRPQPNEVLHGRYDVGKTLGEGAFSVVKLVTDLKSGMECACKFINKELTDKVALQREVGMLEAVGFHKHIVSLVHRHQGLSQESASTSRAKPVLTAACGDVLRWTILNCPPRG